MQRVNGKMTHTERDCSGTSSGFAFSRFTYHLNHFGEAGIGIWQMVDTIEEVIESFEKLITKRKLKTDEHKNRNGVSVLRRVKK